MFQNLGLHVISVRHNGPTKFVYVGSIPMALATMVPATTSDIMGGRAVTSPSGEVLAPKFPAFDTREEAIAFAASKGFAVRS